ncbi:MAG TPA: fatty acid desaturase [Polyangiaceae bacterium]|nr:fatty acid desaturase [Polyangiaceae bacterium]
MRRRDLVCHALHVAFFALALRLVERPWAVALAAAGLYFAGFLVAHDAMHGSLGLGRRANDLVLALSGALIGVAGHGARLLHLRHHARPFSEGDDEGRCGRGPLVRSLLLGPLDYARSPLLAWRKSPRRHRPRMALEAALVAALAASCLASPKGCIALAVTVALNSTIGVWGVRLPHEPAPAVARAAERLAWLRWPVLLGVATHEAHHAAPALPAFALTRAWRRTLGRGPAPQARTSSYSGVLSKTARAKEQTGLTFNPCA